MIIVEMFSKDDCHLCDEAEETLLRLQREVLFELRLRKIREGDVEFEQYRERVPVIAINGTEAFHGRVPERAFLARLRSYASTT